MNKTILIVDDEETIRITLSEWLAATHADAGFEVVMAVNGLEAVKALVSHNVDLLMTDLNMPKMDGFELLAHMNNTYPSTPIIVMSAFATPEIKKKVTDMGVLRFISKPFSFEDLEEIDFSKIFAPPRKKKKGHVNGISLQSFLQLINIESKTCTLTIKSGKKIGTMYLDKGDLLNAAADKMEGDEAAQEIVTWSSKGMHIEIDHELDVTDRKCQLTIMSLLMEAARLQDEKMASGELSDEEEEYEDDEYEEDEVHGQPEEVLQDPVVPLTEKKGSVSPPPAPVHQQSPEKAANLDKLDLIKLQAKLKEFSSIDGFAGAALLTSNGEILQLVRTDGSNIKLEQAGVFANNLLVTAQNSTRNIGLGLGRFVQVDTNSSGHLFIGGCCQVNLMLILASSNSLGLAKMMISKFLKEIASDLGVDL
ncbi:MAG: response regulator [Proteobacteria bacterium]|nr:response regulator [Pseudomonadota bacterium]MBU1686471.1 response regulator [Pseudomonadota bacterium]